MTTQRFTPSHWGWRLVALAAGIGLGTATCTDALGIDGMSVATTTTGAWTSSGGTGGAGAACESCGMTACADVLTSCYLDTAPGGCQAFLTCADACADEICVAGCLAENPSGQLAVDCLCTACAAACGLFCGSGGTGASSAGGGGAGSAGGGAGSAGGGTAGGGGQGG